MDHDRIPDPFHPGEREAQVRAGGFHPGRR